ncbi:MAG: hypothetical protein JJU45_18965 [Acidimicrobiia bacterium]|nr:hypothetical protein [Acidimicrobiia bacterium]
MSDEQTEPTEQPTEADETQETEHDETQEIPGAGDSTEGEGEDQEGEEGDHDPAAAVRAEAKRYRLKLREVEGERDALRSQLEAVHRQEVVRHAEGAGMLADGTDLLLDGRYSIGDLLDADGAVDGAKVTKAVADIVERRPHWQAPREPTNPTGRPVTRLHGGTVDDPGARSWGDVIRRR